MTDPRALTNSIQGPIDGQTVQARDVRGGIHQHLHLAPGLLVVPRQLPMSPPRFVGRSIELRLLSTALSDTQETRRGTAVAAVSGAAGVGKTSLALHWAHQASAQHPDGQLYVDLRGYDASGVPQTATSVIRGFLDAFAVPPERIPAELDAQIALYRSILADRRILVVLDNARSADQVRPLLPGSPTCSVLVTSRDSLEGLIAEGAIAINLDVLTFAEASEFLELALGSDRTDGEPHAVTAIIEWCARLPLALAIVAARTALRPTYSLDSVIGELEQQQAKLDLLETGDHLLSVRTAFSWSYSVLTEESRHLFRLMGLLSSKDVTVQAAASLTGVPSAVARTSLFELLRAQLVREELPGRYYSHDLLMAYALERARTECTDQDRQVALRRYFDYLLHAAFVADREIYPHRDAIDLIDASGPVAEERFTDYQTAMMWFTSEKDNLCAAVRTAAAHGLEQHSWQLAWCLTTFFDRRAHWHEYAFTQEIALGAAERTGDRGTSALLHRLLATAYTRLRRFDDVQRHLADALAFYMDIGDLGGQARTRLSMAFAFAADKRYEEALSHANSAFDLYRQVGHQMGEARALSFVGWYRAKLGAFETAVVECQEALRRLTELDNRWEIAHAHHHLGFAYAGLECNDAACEHYRLAHNEYADLGDQYNSARSIVEYGDIADKVGRRAEALVAWQQALDILASLDHPDAVDVYQRINSPRSADGQ